MRNCPLETLEDAIKLVAAYADKYWASGIFCFKNRCLSCISTFDEAISVFS